MKIKVLGARGTFPSFGNEYIEYGHDTSCYCIMEDDYAIILDCGSGLIGAKEMIRKCSGIDVLLSHVHYDHICGLFEMKDAFDQKEVRFYGNFYQWMKDEREKNKGKTLCHIDELIRGSRINILYGTEFQLHNGYTAVMTESLHPDHTAMIKVRKKDQCLVYTGDYEHDPKFDMEKTAADCSLLLIDGTYAPEVLSQYKGWGHSSWEAGVEIGKRYHIPKVVITHHNPVYDDSFLRRQEIAARQQYAAVRFARQGDEYEI